MIICVKYVEYIFAIIRFMKCLCKIYYMIVHLLKLCRWLDMHISRHFQLNHLSRRIPYLQRQVESFNDFTASENRHKQHYFCNPLYRKNNSWSTTGQQILAIYYVMQTFLQNTDLPCTKE